MHRDLVVAYCAYHHHRQRHRHQALPTVPCALVPVLGWKHSIVTTGSEILLFFTQASRIESRSSMKQAKTKVFVEMMCIGLLVTSRRDSLGRTKGSHIGHLV